MRVLILSATAGQGHHAAAQAVAAVFKQRGDSVSIIDVYAYVSPALRDSVDKGYQLLLKAASGTYGKIYGHLNKDAKISGKHAPGNIANQIFTHELEGYIRKFAADIVISVHPFNTVLLNYMVRKGVVNAITVGIITDFTVHPFMQEAADIDYYVTVDSLLGLQLAKKNLNPDKMLPFGIPVHPKFFRNRDKHEMRRKLGLDPDKSTLLIMSGSTGFGKIDERIRSLDKLDTDFQAMVVCGNNKNLMRKLSSMRLNKSFQIHGYVQNVDEMMSAADCIVTKPGGLTVSEALAKKLPMILTDPIPGQETRNAEFLVNNQLAILAGDLFPVDEAVYTLFEGRYHLDSMREKQEIFAKGNSAAKLVDFLCWEYARRTGQTTISEIE